MKNILEAGGSNLAKVVKCTVLLTDIAHFPEVNAIYAEYFPQNPPARATFAVLALPAGALVESKPFFKNITLYNNNNRKLSNLQI